MTRRDAGIAAALALTVSGIGLSIVWLVVLISRAGDHAQRLDERAATLSGAVDAASRRAARAEASRDEALGRATGSDARASAAEAEVARLRARVEQLEAAKASAEEVAPTPAPAPQVEVVPPPDAAPERTPERPPLVASLLEVTARGRGRVRVDDTLELDLVHVAPGIGSVGADPSALPAAERAARALLPAAQFGAPRVEVVLEEGFLILAAEVTNAQYLGVLAAGGVDLSERRRGRREGYLAHLEQRRDGWEDEPVRCVSWADAVEFCEVLGRLLGAPVRLPSEVEWELAAAGLGPAPRRFPWGQAAPTLPSAGPTGDVTGDGIADLALGVHEWCIDVWASHRWTQVDGVLRHRPSEVVRPLPRASDAMACRGGSGATRSSLQVECAWRQGRLAGTRGPTLGFRIVIPASR